MRYGSLVSETRWRPGSVTIATRCPPFAPSRYEPAPREGHRAASKEPETAEFRYCATRHGNPRPCHQVSDQPWRSTESSAAPAPLTRRCCFDIPLSSGHHCRVPSDTRIPRSGIRYQGRSPDHRTATPVSGRSLAPPEPSPHRCRPRLPLTPECLHPILSHPGPARPANRARHGRSWPNQTPTGQVPPAYLEPAKRSACPETPERDAGQA